MVVMTMKWDSVYEASAVSVRHIAGAQYMVAAIKPLPLPTVSSYESYVDRSSKSPRMDDSQAGII